MTDASADYVGVCIGGVWDGRRVRYGKQWLTAVVIVNEHGATMETLYRYATLETVGVWVASRTTTNEALQKLLASYHAEKARERRNGEAWSNGVKLNDTTTG